MPVLPSKKVRNVFFFKIIYVDLKNIFSKFANKNDYRALTVFAETLEKTGEYKIADKVLDYIKFANTKNVKLAQVKRYDYNSIDNDLKQKFIDAVNKFLDQETTFENFSVNKDIIEALVLSKKEFYQIGKQILMHKFYMPKDSAKRYLSQFYKKTSKDISEKIPNFQNVIKFLDIVENVFIKKGIGINPLDALDPNSMNFQYVFNTKSPVHKEIFDRAKNEMGNQFTSAIGQIKANLIDIKNESNIEQSLNAGEQKYKSNEKKRNFGINNKVELDILKAAIKYAGSDPNSIIDPSKSESKEFFDNDEKKNLIIGYIESELGKLGAEKNSDKQLYPKFFDNEEVKNEAQRLFGAIEEVYKHNQEKYKQWSVGQTQKEIDRLKKEQEDREERLRIGKEWSEEMARRKKSIEEDLADKKPDKKWYEFWKKSLVEYGLIKTSYLTEYI